MASVRIYVEDRDGEWVAKLQLESLKINDRYSIVDRNGSTPTPVDGVHRINALGGGGFGAVVRAKEVPVGLTRAIKLLGDGSYLFEESDTGSNLFIREIRLTNERPYKHIIPIRRHFEFDHFFVIGCPDGISGDVVTEFASSSSPQLRFPAKRIQGNLYAVLWRKPSARVIVVGTESNERLDKSTPVDAADAERWLRHAWALLSGAEVPRPPDYVGKCRRCRFNIPNGCPFPREKRVPNVTEMTTIATAF